MRPAVIAMVMAIAIGATASFADTDGVAVPATVEVTAWQRVSTGDLYLSTRAEGGSWVTHPQPLDMSSRSASGRFWRGSPVSLTVDIHLPSPGEGQVAAASCPRWYYQFTYSTNYAGNLAGPYTSVRYGYHETWEGASAAMSKHSDAVGSHIVITGVEFGCREAGDVPERFR
ncbi:MAG: hypothetical protein F4052_06850 [Dehalococcoidia bacterium]|nr:hypothetical protein [Dehalococcoidia bacterium]MYK26649.1 hypothetical protein [Dehalococcoidia bacterium]